MAMRLAHRMVKELEPDAVWAIDDTGFPKQGEHSVGVERQYSGTLGKTANCQVAVSLHEVCTEGAAILSWRLYLPESWANDPERRAEAGIPEEIRFRRKWELALEMIDEARGWELTDRIIVADAGYGDATAFREELEKRKLRYAVGVQSHTGVWVEPPRPRKLKPKQTGRPPSASHYGKQRPIAVKEAAQKAQDWKKVRWREGSKGRLESRFWAARVLPFHGFHEGRDPGKEIWLLVEWPENAAEPTRYFFCDLAADYSLRRLVQVAKARWKIEQDYQQLKEELGLDHYEGRNWSGWHHHVTLVMLAHSFLTLETLRSKKKLLGGPCRGRVVRFNDFCAPGQDRAVTAAAVYARHSSGSYTEPARITAADVTSGFDHSTNKEINADRFAVQQLRQALDADDWRASPTGYPGRSNIANHVLNVLNVAVNTYDYRVDPWGALNGRRDLSSFSMRGYSHLNLQLRLLIMVYQLVPDPAKREQLSQLLRDALDRTFSPLPRK